MNLQRLFRLSDKYCPSYVVFGGNLGDSQAVVFDYRKALCTQ